MIPKAIVFFWAGFVCSISFMEAWLKFRAPGVTLPVGLSIGRKIFTALNRVEWVFLLLFCATLFGSVEADAPRTIPLLAVVLGILLIQTFLLLPRMTKRIVRIINGETLEKSMLHAYFGAAELVKVAILIYLGFYISVH